MTANALSQRTVIFVNIAHAIDHFVLLIYPTAVIAIAVERGLDYATLITLATGAFVAFGLCSLPMGWIAGWTGRRNLMAVFFFGYAIACFGLSTASSSLAFAAWLLVLGIFSAIYHPIGSAMLVTHARHLGRALGWNGAWGNLGAASASGVTAFVAVTWGWKMAFVVPGLVCLAVGVAFMLLVRGDGEEAQKRGMGGETLPVSRPVALLLVFALAILAGGLTFNMTTIALPQIINERLGLALPLALTGSLATAVFLLGGLTQIAMGHLVERFSLPAIFVGLAILQPLGLGLAASASGGLLLAGMVVAMASIYGQVVVNDAIVARYVPAAYRAKAFSVRYFLGFTVSGFAVPIIAFLHVRGGFPIVLTAMALFGAIVFAAALMFMLIARPQAGRAELPA